MVLKQLLLIAQPLLQGRNTLFVALNFFFKFGFIVLYVFQWFVRVLLGTDSNQLAVLFLVGSSKVCERCLRVLVVFDSGYDWGSWFASYLRNRIGYLRLRLHLILSLGHWLSQYTTCFLFHGLLNSSLLRVTLPFQTLVYKLSLLQDLFNIFWLEVWRHSHSLLCQDCFHRIDGVLHLCLVAAAWLCLICSLSTRLLDQILRISQSINILLVVDVLTVGVVFDLVEQSNIVSSEGALNYLTEFVDFLSLDQSLPCWLLLHLIRSNLLLILCSISIYGILARFTLLSFTLIGYGLLLIFLFQLIDFLGQFI